MEVFDGEAQSWFFEDKLLFIYTLMTKNRKVQ